MFRSTKSLLLKLSYARALTSANPPFEEKIHFLEDVEWSSVVKTYTQAIKGKSHKRMLQHSSFPRCRQTKILHLLTEQSEQKTKAAEIKTNIFTSESDQEGNIKTKKLKKREIIPQTRRQLANNSWPQDTHFEWRNFHFARPEIEKRKENKFDLPHIFQLRLWKVFLLFSNQCFAVSFFLIDSIWRDFLARLSAFQLTSDKWLNPVQVESYHNFKRASSE